MKETSITELKDLINGVKKAVNYFETRQRQQWIHDKDRRLSEIANIAHEMGLEFSNLEQLNIKIEPYQDKMVSYDAMDRVNISALNPPKTYDEFTALHWDTVIQELTASKNAEYARQGEKLYNLKTVISKLQKGLLYLKTPEGKMSEDDISAINNGYYNMKKLWELIDEDGIIQKQAIKHIIYNFDYRIVNEDKRDGNYSMGLLFESYDSSRKYVPEPINISLEAIDYIMGKISIDPDNIMSF